MLTDVVCVQPGTWQTVSASQRTLAQSAQRSARCKVSQPASRPWSTWTTRETVRTTRRSGCEPSHSLATLPILQRQVIRVSENKEHVLPGEMDETFISEQNIFLFNSYWIVGQFFG